MAVDPGDDEESEWRFSLADLEDEEDATEDDQSNIAGEFAPGTEIEAGDIDPENALFVLLGIVVTVATLAGFVLFLP
jgi:hypothetical protein